MARRPLIAGNWKCHKTVSESLQLVTELKRLLASVRERDLVVAPPHTSLWPVAERLEDSNIAVAAQEIFYEDSGAYTGKVSGPMAREAGAAYAIVAHSERRQLFGETLESSNKRVKAALRATLTPIFCVGETLAEREAGETFAVLGKQLDAGLDGIGEDEQRRIAIAYEPVWAIGTGRVATPQQAQEAHRYIRDRLRARSAKVASDVRILYGGSVKPDNAAEILGQEDVDGALVGGASLKAADFVAIARAGRDA